MAKRRAERRRHPRVTNALSVRIKLLSLPTPVEATTRDLGLGGLRVTVRHPLAPGTPLALEIELDGRAEPARVVGEVAWCQELPHVEPGHTKTAHELGVRFLKIAPKDRLAILRLVQVVQHEP